MGEWRPLARRQAATQLHQVGGEAMPPPPALDGLRFFWSVEKASESLGHAQLTTFFIYLRKKMMPSRRFACDRVCGIKGCFRWDSMSWPGYYLAQTGETDKAIAEIQRLLTVGCFEL